MGNQVIGVGKKMNADPENKGLTGIDPVNKGLTGIDPVNKGLSLGWPANEEVVAYPALLEQ